LLDSRGRLIGVNTAIYSPSGTSAGVGFAIPVDTVQRIVPLILRQGLVRRSSLNAEFIPDTWARQLRIKGVLLGRVDPRGAAAKAGLRPSRQTADGDVLWGDLIVAVDEQPVATSEELLAAIESHAVGEQVQLKVVRGFRTGREETLEVNVTLGAERGD
jgi:S1-C subfamily serine protease